MGDGLPCRARRIDVTYHNKLWLQLNRHGGGGGNRSEVTLAVRDVNAGNTVMVASFLSHSLTSLGFSRRMMNNAKRTSSAEAAAGSIGRAWTKISASMACCSAWEIALEHSPGDSAWQR
jgi:hypothetical protein